jgi:phospholipid/cholesterol/gamma-HCH transport system substrate-binding protein
MAHRRGEPTVNPALVGILAAGIMFTLLFFAFANVSLFTAQMQLKAAVESADTLASNADVEVAGVKVGAVNSVDPGSPGALVSMTVNTSQAAIYKDAKAWIRPHGVFGPKFVELDPGTESSGKMESGGTISVGNTKVSIDFEQLLNELNADTRTSLKTALYELGAGSTGRGQDFGQIIDAANILTAQLPAPLEVINSRSENVKRLFDSNAVYTETLGASPIDSLLRENADIFAKLDARRADIGSLVEHGNNLLADLDVITAGNNVAALRATISQLPGLADQLVHFSNGLGYATNSLAPVLIPQYGQADSDIGLAIKRTMDAFGECDITSGGNFDTVHAISVKIAPCYSAPGDGPRHPYGIPTTDGSGHVAHHHVKVLFGLHTNGHVSQLPPEEEQDVLCGPHSGDAARQPGPAFNCLNTSQSNPLPVFGGPIPAAYSASSASTTSPDLLAAPTSLTLFDFLAGF